MNISLLSNIAQLQHSLTRDEANVLFDQALNEFNLQRYVEALDILQVICVAYSDDLDYLTLIGFVYKELKEYDLAIGYLNIVVKHSRNLKLNIEIAECAIATDNYILANEVLSAVVVAKLIETPALYAKYNLLNKFLEVRSSI